jgi:hypothetical protein
VAKEYILGDRKDPNNVFRWDVVRMNLPGSKEYDPTLPWVSKIRLDDGKIAADLFLYVDDGRLTGNSKDEVKQATRVATSRLQELGKQDAPRKRRWGSRRPGPGLGPLWRPLMMESTLRYRRKSGRSRNVILVKPWGGLLGSRDGSLDFKSLESKRGFLIYVTRTYPSMVPYLKGMHLTLDSWRPNWDAEVGSSPLETKRFAASRERGLQTEWSASDG